LDTLRVCVAGLIQSDCSLPIADPETVGGLIQDHHEIEYALAIQPIICTDASDLGPLSRFINSLAAIEYCHGRNAVTQDRWIELLFHATRASSVARLSALWRIRRLFREETTVTPDDLEIAFTVAWQITDDYNSGHYNNARHLGQLLEVCPELVHWENDRICRALLHGGYRCNDLLFWFLRTYSIAPEIESCDLFTTSHSRTPKQILSIHWQQWGQIPQVTYRGSPVWYRFTDIGAVVACRQELVMDDWHGYQICGVYVYFEWLSLVDGEFHLIPNALATRDWLRSDDPPVDVYILDTEDVAQPQLPNVLTDDTWAHIFRQQPKSARSARSS